MQSKRKNNPTLLRDLHRIGQYEELRLTEKDQTFERVGSCNKINSNIPHEPTSDNGMYAQQFDHKELIGFYTGDPYEWIPILVRDQYLTENLKDVCVGEFEFPQNTPYIIGNRPSKDAFISESFIVYDKPIKPKSVRKLTNQEIREFHAEINHLFDEN